MKTLYQAIGYGELKTVREELTYLPEEETGHDVFINSNVDVLLENDGKSYKFHDSLKEHYIMDGKHHIVFYVRFCLDVEKENFVTFLEDATPMDLMQIPGND